LYLLGLYSRHADRENALGQPQLAVVLCKAFVRKLAITLNGMSGRPITAHAMTNAMNAFAAASNEL